MGHRQEENAQIKHQVIRPKSISLKASVGTPKIWLTYSFAPEWFNDALNEARTGQDHHSRRREILFAVCAAESYVFEWVRDEVLRRDFDKLRKYFPPGKRRSVKKKWKKIPKELYEERQISNEPNWGGTEWRNFLKLVRYRDGLVHARASRPETSSLSPDEEPLPSKTDLDRMPLGWAVQRIVTLIRHLHGAVGTSAPDWLVDV